MSRSDGGAGLALGDGGRLARFDPAARLVAALMFAIGTVAASAPTGLGLLLGAAGLLAWAAALPGGRTLRRLAALDGFMAVVLLVLPFSIPGTPLVTLFGLTASVEGLWRAVEIVLTANAVMLALLALAGTQEPVVLGHALARLRLPDGLVTLFLFTVRYVGVLSDELGRLRLAMRARAYRPRGLVHVCTIHGWLLGMALVRSLERAERVMEAMRCRGWKGRLPLIETARVTAADVALVAGLAALPLAVLLWEHRP